MEAHRIKGGESCRGAPIAGLARVMSLSRVIVPPADPDRFPGTSTRVT
jgi:hypothetical protein